MEPVNNNNKIRFICIAFLLDHNFRGKQPHLSVIVQSRRLSLFGHIAQMPDETDAKQILTDSPAGNWRKPLGRPRITWMKTIQQDLKSSDLNMDDAVDLAQTRPLWRLMSTFGATHS